MAVKMKAYLFDDYINDEITGREVDVKIIEGNIMSIEGSYAVVFPFGCANIENGTFLVEDKVEKEDDAERDSSNKADKDNEAGLVKLTFLDELNNVDFFGKFARLVPVDLKTMKSICRF